METKEVKIEKIVQEAPGIKSIFFKKIFDYKPGQFIILKEVINKISREEVKRPYTIASSPSEKNISFTFRIVQDGKMTHYLDALKEGDILHIIGPFGDFIFDEEHRDIVCIAGGVGVSPFRSIIKYVQDKKLPARIILFYSARKSGELLFKKEFDEIAKKSSSIKIIYTITRDDPAWKGTRGRISREMMHTYIDDVKKYWFYVCGPPGMKGNIEKILGELGVKKEKIKIDVWG